MQTFWRTSAEAITRIERYTAGLTLDAFLADTKTQDATVRNLIIGEAVKGLSSDFRKKHQGVPWQDVVRDTAAVTPKRSLDNRLVLAASWARVESFQMPATL